MSKKIADLPELNMDVAGWATLLEEVKKEDAANPDLTDEEKHLLDELDQLPDDKWEPIVCHGKSLSEIIIDDRGERCYNI